MKRPCIDTYYLKHSTDLSMTSHPPPPQRDIFKPPPSLPVQIIAVLLESERRYVTGLTLLNSHYQQPMRMLSSFKPEILSMQQLNLLFLNW